MHGSEGERMSGIYNAENVYEKNLLGTSYAFFGGNIVWQEFAKQGEDIADGFMFAPCPLFRDALEALEYARTLRVGTEPYSRTRDARCFGGGGRERLY